MHACFRSRSSGGRNDDGEGEDGSCLFVLITRGFCPLDWIWMVKGLLPGSGWPKPNHLLDSSSRTSLVRSHGLLFFSITRGCFNFEVRDENSRP
jgi:hypothetical protein